MVQKLVNLSKLANHIWHLRLNRPTQHNAFNTALAQELIEHCHNINENLSKKNVLINAVLLSGEGKSFCSGADLKERKSLESFEQWQEQHKIFEDMFNAIAKIRPPTIACVEGYALAGGFELALNCDLIVSSKAAKLGLPEVTRGIMPGGGGTQLLARLIGPARAKHIAMTGCKITGQQAFEMGIVQVLTDPGQAISKGIDLANEIATNAPLSARAIKQAIDEGWGKSLDESKQVELKYYATLIETKDRLEGIAAFNEKRKPQWKGC